MRTEEEECLLFPSPPAEGEYLLVSPSLPRGEEDQELPPQSQHYPLSTVFPATEGDQHQSPATEGDYPLLSPPPPGNYLLLLPPSSGGDCPQLPPPPAEGCRVRGRSGAPAAASMARGSPPEFASRGSAAAAVASRGSAAAAVASRGSAAAVVASRGSAAAALASRGSAAAALASRGSAAAAVASLGSAAAAVASRGSAAAAVAWGRQGSCFAWGRQGMAGAPEKGAAGHEERGRGQETSPQIFRARGAGRCVVHCDATVAGQETSSPSRTFAAGYTVVGTPQRGAAGHEEGGGGQETSSPSRTFAAGYTVVGTPQRGAAGHEEGGEVRRPAPPAALSRQEEQWLKPRKRELPARKTWGEEDLPPWPPPWITPDPLPGH
ncbi:UNVERIFIED_CONTAM: hypothetical protein FKN15_045724 [Acipenser sinensis]